MQNKRQINFGELGWLTLLAIVTSITVIIVDEVVFAINNCKYTPSFLLLIV